MRIHFVRKSQRNKNHFHKFLFSIAPNTNFAIDFFISSARSLVHGCWMLESCIRLLSIRLKTHSTAHSWRFAHSDSRWHESIVNNSNCFAMWEAMSSDSNALSLAASEFVSESKHTLDSSFESAWTSYRRRNKIYYKLNVEMDSFYK